jgi:hypothetical protein
VLNAILANSVDDERLLDKAFGIGSLVNGAASACAPLLFGLVTDTLGIVRVFQVSALFAIAAVIPMMLRIAGARRAR